MSISIPADADGLTGRECPSGTCSPGYFKVKGGTGLSGQIEAFCPYCRHAEKPGNFATKAQQRYVKEIAVRETHKGIQQMIGDGLGLGPGGSKHIGSGFLTLELKYKPGPLPHVSRPIGEELRRDVTCPFCGLEHAVYGLAVWCADCGRDIFMAHVEKEFSVVKAMLGDVERRRNELGNRVAARDVENALEDTVSIFEAVLRALTRRHLKNLGRSEEEIDDVMAKRVANRYQNIESASELVKKELGVDLFAGYDVSVVEGLKRTFEKRHPITHNLGIVDRKYLEKARSGELQGREIRVTAAEVQASIELVTAVVAGVHCRLFPAPEGA